MPDHQTCEIFKLITEKTYQTPKTVRSDFFGGNEKNNALHDLISLFARQANGSLLSTLLNILLEMPDGYRKYALIGKALGLEKCDIFHPNGIPDCFPPHTVKGDKLLLMRNLYNMERLPDSFKELDKTIYSGTVNGVYAFREYIHFEGWHHKWNFTYNDNYYAYPQLHDRLDLVNMLAMPCITAYRPQDSDTTYDMHEFHNALMYLIKKDYIADISLRDERHPLWKALRVSPSPKNLLRNLASNPNQVSNRRSLVERLFNFYSEKIESDLFLRSEIYKKIKDSDLRKKLFPTPPKTENGCLAVFFRRNPKKSNEENSPLPEDILEYKN